MKNRELIDYCLTYLSTYEDRPFNTGDAHSDDGSWAIIRHRQNKKGFAHIYERGGKLCINLKCDPLESDFLRNVYTNVKPAYHMNKVHWNTVELDGDVPEDELKRLIGLSYHLTKPKAKRSMSDN